MQSVLPSLLNVAQIINLITNDTVLEIGNEALTEKQNSVSSITPHLHWSTSLVDANKKSSLKMEQQQKQQLQRQQNQEQSFMLYDIWQDDECNLEVIATHSQRVIKLIFNDDYDKHLTPDPNGVTVSIELALQTFYDISENSASFTADVLMR